MRCLRSGSDVSDPTQEDLLGLHRAHEEGDPVAGARLAELVLPALRRRFANAPVTDPQVVDSTIGYSIARYLAEPERYQPARGPLLAWLYQDVRGDLLNERAKQARRKERPLSDDDAFADRLADGNPSPEEAVVERLDRFDLPPSILEQARTSLAELDEMDRHILLLMEERVRATAAYAEVMDIAHLPVQQQRAAVKRAKDRLTKRMEALRDKLSRTD